jgi:hypothetical protein
MPFLKTEGVREGSILPQKFQLATLAAINYWVISAFWREGVLDRKLWPGVDNKLRSSLLQWRLMPAIAGVMP